MVRAEEPAYDSEINNLSEGQDPQSSLIFNGYLIPRPHVIYDIAKSKFCSRQRDAAWSLAELQMSEVQRRTAHIVH
jgi:hypothetical protein